MMVLKDYYDVIVVGAGPAGTSAATKCAELGFTTLLLEKFKIPREKTCGGLLTPVCVEILREELEVEIPESVYSEPSKLGLFYVPPSGKRNSKSVRNYEIYNVERVLFDALLTRRAEDAGANLQDEEVFKTFEEGSNRIRVKTNKNSYSTRFLIGADGVYSRVRKCFKNFKTINKRLLVLQEHVLAEGKFCPYFYVFFRGEITPTYAYLIPKKNVLILGTGTPHKWKLAPAESMAKFKEWLRGEFNYRERKIVKRETWPIPFGYSFLGRNNIVLIGDAAGFCNAFSGEGIRLAIESGIQSGESVKLASDEDEDLSAKFQPFSENLEKFVKRTVKFVAQLDDEAREKFVQNSIYARRRKIGASSIA